MSAEPRAPGWFDLGRTPPFPAIYPAYKTPVTVDVLEVGWIVAFFAILLSFCIILPAASNRVSRLVRVPLFLFLGLVIMLCNFGQEWEVGDVHTRTQYRAGTSEEIEADIGVKLGLRSVNITLKRTSTDGHSALSGETINYNERFTWAWAQGRAGFGPFAGQIQRDYRAAQYRGLPYPILWIAEYFTFDGEGIRFGRYYRTSGWYAHICIWGAFPMWLLTAVLFKMVVKYAALALSITGTLMVIPAIIWAANRNFIELQIPFEDGVLSTHFGVHWYLSLIVGIICILVGFILWFLDDIYNEEICQFFGNNPLNILDEGVAEEEAVEAPASNEHEMERMDVAPEAPRLVATFRGRGTSTRRKKQKSFILPPVNRSAKLAPLQEGMHLGYQGQYPSTSDYQHGVPNQGYVPDSRHGGYGTAGQQQQQQGYRYPEDYNRQHPPTSGYLQSASNEGFEPDLRRGGYDNAGRQQGHRHPAPPPPPPQSEIYDDLQNDDEQTIYENIQPKLRASPNLPPKPKKF